MRIYSAMVAILSLAASFTASAHNIDCTADAGSSTSLKRFSFLTSESQLSGAFLIGEGQYIDLLGFPNLAKNINITRDIKQDGGILSLEMEYVTHDRLIFAISIDLKNKTAHVKETERVDGLSQPLYHEGDYHSCSVRVSCKPDKNGGFPEGGCI